MQNQENGKKHVHQSYYPSIHQILMHVSIYLEGANHVHEDVNDDMEL